MNLKEKYPVQDKSVTDVGGWICGARNHLFQQVAIVIDGERSEDTAPKKNEAHTQIENSVKFFPSPYFPDKCVI